MECLNRLPSFQIPALEFTPFPQSPSLFNPGNHFLQVQLKVNSSCTPVPACRVRILGSSRGIARKNHERFWKSSYYSYMNAFLAIFEIAVMEERQRRCSPLPRNVSSSFCARRVRVSRREVARKHSHDLNCEDSAEQQALEHDERPRGNRGIDLLECSSRTVSCVLLRVDPSNNCTESPGMICSFSSCNLLYVYVVTVESMRCVVFRLFFVSFSQVGCLLTSCTCSVFSR